MTASFAFMVIVFKVYLNVKMLIFELSSLIVKDSVTVIYSITVKWHVKLKHRVSFELSKLIAKMKKETFIVICS